jgi:hypothetical protein
LFAESGGDRSERAIVHAAGRADPSNSPEKSGKVFTLALRSGAAEFCAVNPLTGLN